MDVSYPVISTALDDKEEIPYASGIAEGLTLLLDTNLQ
jgi:hypothetical protein